MPEKSTNSLLINFHAGHCILNFGAESPIVFNIL